MALILRSTIPKALLIISQNKLANLVNLSKLENNSVSKAINNPIPIPISNDFYETCCTNILVSCENKPFIENNLTSNGNLIYTARNINEIIEKIQKDYKLDCCNECGNC